MEQQCYARSSALLGPLVSLHPLYTDVYALPCTRTHDKAPNKRSDTDDAALRESVNRKVQGAHGDQYNTLPMVASAPRFRYLPITEPAVKGKEKGECIHTLPRECARC
jgi:hypothetical protein